MAEEIVDIADGKLVELGARTNVMRDSYACQCGSGYWRPAHIARGRDYVAE